MGTTTATENQTEKRCDASKVKVGDFYTLYGSGFVTDVLPRGLHTRFHVRNHTGYEYQVDAGVLENEYSFASQSNSEEGLTRTVLIAVLRDNPRTAMTVTFRKQADHKAVADALAAGQGDAAQRTWRSKVKKLMAGELRTMVGYHTNEFTEHGRLLFHAQPEGLRQVDPRSIESLTVGLVTYTVKK